MPDKCPSRLKVDIINIETLQLRPPDPGVEKQENHRPGADTELGERIATGKKPTDIVSGERPDNFYFRPYVRDTLERMLAQVPHPFAP